MAKEKNQIQDEIEYSKYSMDTLLINGKNVSNKWDYNHHVTAPISSSTTFKLDSVERGAEGFMQFAHTDIHGDDSPILIYDRLGEPNKDILEENLAHIEKGEMAVTFTSGMAAISGILGTLAKAGDEIITHTTLYGCTISLFTNWYPRFNIKVTTADLTNLDNINTLINDSTKVIYFETPANPNMDIIDIISLRKILDAVNEKREPENQISIVVDNTFATSFCQRPIELGADFTVHSLTKGMGGFGTDMGGVVIGKNKYRDALLLYRKDFGAVLTPKSAWSILTYGLPSLAVRQNHQVSSAMKIAEFLENHPKVDFVRYPGLKSHPQYEKAKEQMIDFNGNFAPGSLIYFTLKGNSPEDTKENGRKLMNYIAKNAYTMTLAVSLGHTKTLIEHPASMTHSVVPADKLEERGFDAGGVRLAIGLENVKDILMDLEESLNII